MKKNSLAREIGEYPFSTGGLSSEELEKYSEDNPFTKGLSKDRDWITVANPLLPSTDLVISQNPDEARIDHDIFNAAIREERPVLFFPVKAERTSYFISLQKWEGSVIKVKPDSFLAKLVDMNNEALDEEADILISEVSEDDLPLVVPGAIFYWTIGYYVAKSRQRKRESVIRFRRLPEWKTEEIVAAEREAEESINLLGWK